MVALGGGDGSARGKKGEQRRWRRRGGRNRLAHRREGRGAPALAAGKRGKRDREEREKGRGPTGRGEARGGGGGISRRTAVGRGAAQVLPARGGRGERGKKIKEIRKRRRWVKNIPKNRDGKGIPSQFRDGKQIPSLFKDGKKKKKICLFRLYFYGRNFFVSIFFRDGIFSVSI